MHSVPTREQRRDNVPSSEHPSGSAESFTVRTAWLRDGVVCCEGDGLLPLLDAAHGCGTAECRDGHYYQIHPQWRVEMVMLLFLFCVFSNQDG